MGLPIKRPCRLGTTFSQLQCSYLGINYQEAFEQVCSMGFNIIRLCSYWNEVEPVKNQFDFQVIDWLLNQSQKYSIEVVLTVGMKSPRWPEYHFPNWLRDRYDTSKTNQPLDANPAIADYTLRFIQAVIDHTKYAPNLKYWQIENEPLTQLEITAGRFLSYEFLRQEVELTRKLALPRQKILLTNAIHLPSAELQQDDQAFAQSLTLADAVGMNVYTKVAINSQAYLQPLPLYWQKLSQWHRKLTEAGKESWISEAQAEPWEYQKLIATEQAQYPSASPQQSTDLTVTLAQIGYETVMLWGCEYWCWHKQQGHNEWWTAMNQLIKSEHA